jgi:hypothetical protein
MPGLVSDSDGSVDLLDSMPSDNQSKTSADEPITSESTVSSCNGSSDSEPISRKARKYVAKQLAKRRKQSVSDGLSETIGPLLSVATSCQELDGPADPLNLWTALPPSNTQCLDLAARLDSDDVSDRSTRCSLFLANEIEGVVVIVDMTCSESGELSSGFISNNDDCFNPLDQVALGTSLTLLQQKTLMRFFPITCKRMLDFGV